MNDPNGLVFLDGEYHLFYQHNPEGDKWGHMSWGHAVSRDLLRWEHLPLAMREEDGIMIFSGSAVVDASNTSGLCGTAGASCLIAIYTGHTEKRQTQNLAFSHDRGRTWTKYPGNPVLDLSRRDHRDPKVFWHEPSKRWVMVSVLAGERKVRFFSSSDLKRWEMLSDFGPAGATGGAWECPDLFPLPVDGDPQNVRWVLDVDLNPGGRVGGSGAQSFRHVRRHALRRRQPRQPDALGGLRQGLLRQPVLREHSGIRRPAAVDRMDEQLGLRRRRAHVAVARRPVASARVSLRRTPDGIRLVQTPLRELAARRATREGQPIDAGRALPGAAEIELDRHDGPRCRRCRFCACPTARARRSLSA